MKYENLINGKLIRTPAQMDIINPATEMAFATVFPVSSADMNNAIETAKEAFEGWSKTSLAERQELLHQIADIIDQNKDTLARALTQEQGKVLREAIGEIELAVLYCRHVTGMHIPCEILQDDVHQRVEAHQKPLGVVAAIIPWNYPIFVMINKLAPALLAGNTIIVKPAPSTPVSSLMFGQMVKDIIPNGVVSIIADDGSLGPLLTAHPSITKISFTGSTETGKAVLRNSVETIKRTTLELGGNDAALLLEDVSEADLKEIFDTCFENSGQVCNTIKRLYVPADSYASVCKQMAHFAAQAVIGNGLDDKTDMGPVQNRAQFDKINALIEQSRQHGTIIAGGIPLRQKGYFISPTIVADIGHGAPLVDQEQFGPVLPIIRYTDTEDAIRCINASPFGLSASVWSKDNNHALSVAHRIECGTVWINQHGVIGPHIPCAPMKQSGLGTEGALEGLLSFTARQIINIKKQV